MTNDSLTPEQVAVLDELPHREPYLSFRRIVISQARRVVELESALLSLKLAVVGHENTRHVHEPRAATETSDARSAKDCAIEHACYLATAADNYLHVCQSLPIGEASLDVIDQHSAAARALESRIYEFRKRADRASQPPTPVLTSTGHEDAQHQIAMAVHVIQSICGEWGYDPCEWLNDQTAIEDPTPKRWHCNICGGDVSLVSATAPTAKIGPGGKRSVEPGAGQ